MNEPPDVDRLAELDADIAAGLPVDPAATADPASRAVLDALAATRADLAALPPVPLPPELTARWVAALDAARVEDTSRHAGGAPPAPAAGTSLPAGLTPDTLAPPDPGSTTRPATPDTVTRPDPGSTTRPATPDTVTRPDPGSTPRPATPRLSGGSASAPDGDARAATPPGGIANAGASMPPGSESPAPPGRARKEVPGQRFPRTGRPARRAVTGPTGAPSPAGPPRRPRRTRPAIAAGLALAVLLVVAGVLGSRTAAPSVTAAQLGGFARAAVGAHDAGELADPVRRAGCLRSVAPPALDPDALLIGGRGVEFEGRPGILLVFASGRLGTFRVVVVDPACGPDGGTLLADTQVGG